MGKVTACPLPSACLLSAYAKSGNFTDCYHTSVPGQFDLEQFVLAFYTTRLFRLERWILSWAVSKSSTDDLARRLAAGTSQQFAAWTVEARTADELLMCDFMKRTRSWFKVEPSDTGEPSTRLCFGSAVVARSEKKGEAPTLGAAVSPLLAFHKLYSRMLLNAARRALTRLDGTNF